MIFSIFVGQEEKSNKELKLMQQLNPINICINSGLTTGCTDAGKSQSRAVMVGIAYQHATHE